MEKVNFNGVICKKRELKNYVIFYTHDTVSNIEKLYNYMQNNFNGVTLKCDTPLFADINTRIYCEVICKV